MSFEEFNAYMKGEILTNNVDHARYSKTNSKGFCFFPQFVEIETERDYEMIAGYMMEDSIHGITSHDVLVAFDTNEKLCKGWGNYACPSFLDYDEIISVPEYSIESYSKETLQAKYFALISNWSSEYGDEPEWQPIENYQGPIYGRIKGSPWNLDNGESHKIYRFMTEEEFNEYQKGEEIRIKLSRKASPLMFLPEKVEVSYPDTDVDEFRKTRSLFVPLAFYSNRKEDYILAELETTRNDFIEKKINFLDLPDIVKEDEKSIIKAFNAASIDDGKFHHCWELSWVNYIGLSTTHYSNQDTKLIRYATVKADTLEAEDLDWKTL
jgi:hypothetical protein